MTPKVKAIEEKKIDQRYLIRINMLCALKDTINCVERQFKECKKKNCISYM